MLLASVGGEPKLPTEAAPPALGKCMRALELLIKIVPGMLEAQSLAARALYLNGNLEAAERRAAEALRTNPDAYLVHLLVCSIYVQQNKAQLAVAALDEVRSPVTMTLKQHFHSYKVHSWDCCYNLLAPGDIHAMICQATFNRHEIWPRNDDGSL
jgi:hypothetical protein